jgi:alkyl hydroperoxide reductase subunit AhpC
LYEELRDRNFVVISVADDTDGAAAAGTWIRAANPSYPCLIDQRHIVAELYNMVNVPSAVWINEEGLMVRPESATNSAPWITPHTVCLTTRSPA